MVSLYFDIFGLVTSPMATFTLFLQRAISIFFVGGRSPIKLLLLNVGYFNEILVSGFHYNFAMYVYFCKGFTLYYAS